MINKSKCYKKFFLSIICVLILIISIPVLSVRSGYAQIQTSSNSELDGIINQKQQDEQAKREALNSDQHVVGGSQEVSLPDPMLEDILKQNEIDNHLKDTQSSEKLEIISDPKGSVTDLGEQPDYTFLIYMIGSDLELKQYSATEDIQEMLNVGSNKDVNIIIETGGSKSSVTDGERFIDFTTVQRHKIMKHHHQTLEDLGRENMATSNTLSDFLTWGVSEFPAKKYVAILWDHGSGINGFGADSNFNGDILTPVELAKAFDDTKDSTRTNFEVIGFDACLMASIEVANTVKSFGNYMVASQDIIPPAGWDYSTFLTSLVKNPNQDGLELGRNIADSFQEYYRTNAQVLGYDVYLVTTISIINLHKVSDMVDSIKVLAAYLNHSISDVDSAKNFSRLIDSTDSYGKSSTSHPNLVDIFDLSFNVMRKYPDSFDTVDRIHKMLKSVVVYKVNGESKPNAHGLSIYLPNADGSHLSQSLVNTLDTWQNIINKQYYYLQTDKQRPSVRSQTLGNTIFGWIDPNDIANVTLVAGHRTTSGIYSSFTEEIDPSKIITKNGYFRYSWSGEIISLCNGDKCSPTNMNFDSNGYNKLALFPVTIYTPTNIIIGLSLLYDINESEGRIKFLGAIPNTKTEDTFSKERYKFPPNSTVYPSKAYGNSVRGFVKSVFDLSRTYQERSISSLLGGANFSVDEKGLLTSTVNNTDKINKLLDTIDVTDSFGPRYAAYNGSSAVTLIFCDYSNNCYQSSTVFNTTPVDNSLSSTKNTLSNSTENFTGFDTYENSESGVRFMFPKEWSSNNKTEIFEFGKKTPAGEVILNYKSGLEELVISKASADSFTNISPQQWASHVIKEIALNANFNLVDSKPTILSGKLAHKIVYNHTEGQNKLMTTIFLKSGANPFLIRYICPAADYSHNLPTILKIIRSFKIMEADSRVIKDPIYLTYENPVSGIKMQYNSQWKKYEHFGILPSSPVASFFSPLENDRDKYQEHINVYIQPLPLDFHPQNNTNKHIDYLMRSTLSSSYFKIHDLPLASSSMNAGWHRLSYLAENGTMRIGVAELWKIIDNKVYRVEFLYEWVKYSEYEPVFSRMLNSFRIDPLDAYGWSFLTYEDPSSDIRIQHPFDWQLQPYNRDALHEGGGAIVVFSPLTSSNSTDPLKKYPPALVEISIQESNATSDKDTNNLVANNLDDAVNNYTKLLMNSIPDFKLLKMDQTSFSDAPAIRMIYTSKINNHPIKFMMVAAILDNALYRSTYISLEDRFDKFLPKVTHMIESFKKGLE